MSGDRLLSRQEFFRAFLENQDHAYMEDLTHQALRDRGVSDFSGEDVSPMDIDTLLNTPSIKKRGLFAPRKQDGLLN